MKHQRHFDTTAASQREATQIWKMIGDLHRSVQLLDCDITAEEERTRVSDMIGRRLSDSREDDGNAPR